MTDEREGLPTVSWAPPGAAARISPARGKMGQRALSGRYSGEERGAGAAEGVALRLLALGGLSLAAPDDRPVAPLLAQPKRLALLLYLALALPRGFHRRDTLLCIFWPELNRTRARLSLRQALHFLRRSLPPGLLVSRGAEEVGLVHPRLASDVAAFDRQLDAGQEAEALAHYRGDLLPGFHLSDSPEFDAWLEQERDRLRRRAVRAALVLGHRLAETGELPGAAEWLHFAVERAPFEETTLRDAVSVLARHGDRVAALRLSTAFSERLRTELGVEPSAETARLITELWVAPGERSGRKAEQDAKRVPILAAVPEAAAGGGGSSTRAPAAPAPPEIGRLSPDAHRAYLRGRHHDQQRTPASMQRALEYYRRAVALEPDFAAAHAGIARALSVLAVYRACPPAEVYPRVKHHASRALALDPSLAEAHTWLANALLCYEWDWRGAERALARALALAPDDAEARTEYALYLLTPTGRFAEALTEIETARELDPLSLPINAYLAMVSYFARRYERAVREAEATLELDEHFPLAWWVLGMAREQSGRLEDALAAFERCVELTHGSSLMLAQLGRARALAGDREAAAAVLRQLEERAEIAGPALYFAASIHAALGESAAALDALQHAYRERIPHLVFTGVFPALDPLRGERRFRELLLRLGLR